MEVTVNVADYTQKWLVFKKMRGTPYFFRGNNYTVTSVSVRHAFLFDKKEEADTKAAELTAKKTGYKFRVDNASKYFVNSFEFQHNMSYYTPLTEKFKLSIISKKISVKQVTTHKANHVLDLNSKKDSLISFLENNKTKALQAVKDREKQLEATLKREKEEIELIKTRASEMDTIIDDIVKQDFNTYIEPFITTTDKNVAVLFSKKEHPKTLQSQDMSRPHMLILPLKP